MIADPCFHCWCHPQSLMNSTKIVVHKVERQRVLMVLQLLRKSVSQARKSPHGHTHCEILTLRVGGRNVLVVWITADNGLASAAGCYPNSERVARGPVRGEILEFSVFLGKTGSFCPQSKVLLTLYQKSEK
jgi:hypothetical protein